MFLLLMFTQMYFHIQNNETLYCLGNFSPVNILSASLSTVQYTKKKKWNIPIYFNTNHRTEMKLVPVFMDYCLLQFDALKFFLGVRLHGGSRPNFNFFNGNPQISRRNRKARHTNCLKTNFYNISNISLRVIRHRNYS